VQALPQAPDDFEAMSAVDAADVEGQAWLEDAEHADESFADAVALGDLARELLLTGAGACRVRGVEVGKAAGRRLPPVRRAP
jgi:hypothetical protein